MTANPAGSSAPSAEKRNSRVSKGILSCGPPAATMSKAADRSQAAPGEVITYTITYRNDSPAVIQNVVLTDRMPQYTAYVPNSTQLNGTTLSPDPFAGGQISVPIASVAASASGTVVFKVTVQ